MKRFLWSFIATLALVLSACTQPSPTIETSSAQPPVISRFGASPTSGQAPLLVRFFWSISDANRDLMSCELDVAYDGNFTADYSVGLPRTRTSNCTSSSRINHTFGVGTHTVALRVCDATSCTTRSQVITVAANPNNRSPVITNFAANPNPIRDNLPTTFSWTVSDPENNPLTCAFDPDTATTGNEQVVPCNQTHNHTYTSIGNFTAQLSVTDGNSTTNQQTAVEVLAGFSQVSAGFSHTCTLSNTGQAYCWGYNDYGQLGNGNNTDANTPQPVTMPTGVTFTQISAGSLHTCALSTTGQAYCWGWNSSGQLGKGNSGSGTDANTPQLVTMPTGVTFTQVSARTSHTCALSTTGQAYCWGSNGDGELGNSNNTDANTPQPISMPTGVTFTQISAGNDHTCALGSNNHAYCWGRNNYGQLGKGDNTAANSPQPVSMPTGVTFSHITSANDHTCTLGSNNQAYCWGWNIFGQLGNGNNTNANSTPQPVTMPTGVTFTQVSVRLLHTCALGSNNQAYCWGSNDYGQLGTGNTGGTANTPQAVSMPNGVTFSQITAGGFHTCALGSNNQAYCWGYNLDGQLGNGNTGTDANTPQAVVMP